MSLVSLSVGVVKILKSRWVGGWGAFSLTGSCFLLFFLPFLFPSFVSALLNQIFFSPLPALPFPSLHQHDKLSCPSFPSSPFPSIYPSPPIITCTLRAVPLFPSPADLEGTTTLQQSTPGAEVAAAAAAAACCILQLQPKLPSPRHQTCIPL